MFFYANGHLCFYHVHRNGKPYHFYENDEDGFSRLYACPWTPEQTKVDLSAAVVRRLPVVGETTFAWGQLNKQIVTGSNIGGFYVFEGTLSAEELKAYTKERLAAYKYPRIIEFSEGLPKGPTGKILKRELR